MPAGDNRWQRGKVVDALYFADSEACAWAEWYRHLAGAGLPPNVALPRDLWCYDISPLHVADLSNVDQLARAGLPQPLPGRRGWPTFQATGTTDGNAHLTVPRRPGSRSVPCVTPHPAGLDG